MDGGGKSRGATHHYAIDRPALNDVEWMQIPNQPVFSHHVSEEDTNGSTFASRMAVSKSAAPKAAPPMLS